MKFIEAFLGSLGIMLVGWWVIPAVGQAADVAITPQQAIHMSGQFFVLRLAYLYFLRLVFSRSEK